MSKLSKNLLIKTRTELRVAYQILNKYIKCTDDRGFTEDALQNIEDAINNVNKSLK